MAIRESLLDALNSIATSDFVRSVTSAGASTKVTVSNLAKTIVENYTGSTLAGSSQSVKSAIDTIALRFASYVPTSRKVNNKALSSDISLTASDVSAVAKSGDTMTGNLTVTASDDAERWVRASNSKGNVNLDIGQSGNHGIWSNATPTHKWLLKADTSGNVYVNDTPFPNFATYSNNTFKIGNFVIWFGVASSVANGGTKSVAIPSGTFDSVYKGIAYCAQNSFGGYSTCVMNSATTTSATVYQYNSANATMNVGVVVFGIKN